MAVDHQRLELCDRVFSEAAGFGNEDARRSVCVGENLTNNELGKKTDKGKEQLGQKNGEGQPQEHRRGAPKERLARSK